MDHPGLVDRIADILSKVGGFIGALVAGWGVIKIAPRFFSHAKLALELSTSLEALRIAEKAAEQYRLAADAYRERIDGLVADLEAARGDIAAAAVYIVDLIEFIKTGRPLSEAPPIPDELQQVVHQVLTKRKRAAEAAKEHPPFPG